MAISTFPFSEMMLLAMKELHMNYTQLSDLLQEKGVRIDRKRLSEYGRQVTTPPLENAWAIAKILELDLDEEALLQSVKQNRLVIESNKEKRQNLRQEVSQGSEHSVTRTAVVNFKGLIDGMSTEEVGAKIKKKISLLYGKDMDNDKMFGFYVRDLIRKDLLMEEE